MSDYDFLTRVGIIQVEIQSSGAMAQHKLGSLSLKSFRRSSRIH